MSVAVLCFFGGLAGWAGRFLPGFRSLPCEHKKTKTMANDNVRRARYVYAVLCCVVSYVLFATMKVAARIGTLSGACKGWEQWANGWILALWCDRNKPPERTGLMDARR